jgi:hypothetical protein
MNHNVSIAGILMPSMRTSETLPARLTVSLEATERAELDRLASEKERSLAWLCRQAIREYLSRNSRTDNSGGG